MGQTSEAACLLKSGALYHRRLGLRPAAGRAGMVFAGFKHGAASIYFDDEPIYHFDLEGRWQRAYRGGAHYLKALDTSVVALDRVREGGSLVLQRRPLPFAQISDLDAAIRAMALELIEGLNTGAFVIENPPSMAAPLAVADLLDFLDRVAKWDAAAWFAHRERYTGTYGPLGFLPPEAQQAVVLQAALGHARGVAFGLALAAEPYVRSAAEFAEHAADVAALMGRRILQCRWIYVGGGDLLHLPVEEVRGYFEAATRAFPVPEESAPRRLTERSESEPRLDGLVALAQDLSAPLPDRAGWAILKQARLRRVVLAIESGSQHVRDLYSSSYTYLSIQETVADLKAAGLAVSVVLLVGAGGREHAEGHVVDSAELVLSLELGAGDLVYLVAADEVGGDRGRRRMQELGLTPPGPADLEQQRTRLLGLLAPLRKERKVKVVPYTLDKQWS